MTAQISLFLLFALVVCIVSSAFGQLDSFYSPSEQEQTKQFAKQSLKDVKSLKAAYYATRVLNALQVTDLKCGCSSINSLFESSAHTMDVFYGLSTGSACGCANVKLGGGSKALIKSGLKVKEINVIKIKLRVI